MNNPDLIYEACRRLTPEATFHDSAPCIYCLKELYYRTDMHVSVRLQEHEEYCPLRIVLKATLNYIDNLEGKKGA